MSSDFDVGIIGGGPGGYVAAIRASQLGLTVAVVEERHLGGICLNWGCIPTKALLKTSEVIKTIKKAGNFGIKASFDGLDLEKIVGRSRDVSKKLSTGIGHLMKKNKVKVFSGRGKIAAKGKISIEIDDKKQEIGAKNIIIATGARARVLKGIEPDSDSIWSYREAMVPKSVPKSILVIGSGAIGIEFASFYNAIGVEVTIVEMMDRILPVEDKEISNLAHKSFEKQGIKLKTNTIVKSVNKKESNIEVTHIPT